VINENQHETLILADIMEAKSLGQKTEIGDYWADGWCGGAATELRRLHSVNAELLEALKFIAGESMSMHVSYTYMIEKLQDIASAAIAKATGANNG
jgi:hypothetical protein